MENKVTVSQIGVRYGLIFGLVMIVYTLILQISGMATNQWLSNASFILLIIVIIIAHKAFKEGGDGFMTIGQGIGIGTLLSLISGVISSVFLFIYLKFVDDSMLQMVRDEQIEKMSQQGMDDAQIEQAMEMAGKFMGPVAILIFGIIGSVLGGLILSLIISLFTKKANPAAEV
jgi:NAD/NADP transhydrogenase alpha subunit